MDVPDEVLRRVGHQVFPHYDAATGFPRFYTDLTEKMRKVFGLPDGEGDVFIPSGSGTLAVNMALASLCTPEDEVLILDNGGGEYAEKNLAALGVPYRVVKGQKGKASDPDQVRAAMREKRSPFIFMTQNESSTAVLNPIPPIGEIAREFDALLIVDSVSGVGGVVVDMGENGADVVAGASQKCLELPPGLAPVAVGPRAWAYIDSRKNRRVPYYLDLKTWKNAADTQREEHPQPVTGNTVFLYALDWTVDRILAEGVYNRQERFRAAGNRLREGMAELGFRMSADPRFASPVVTDFFVPEGFVGEDVRSWYLEKHNTMVGYGFAYRDERGRSLTFRIAHFGVSADPERVEHMIRITRQFVEEHR
jgi:aspartate aminotransferase-like enzyme